MIYHFRTLKASTLSWNVNFYILKVNAVEDDTWPPNEIERILKALYFQSNSCDLDIETFLNPLVKVIRNIYTGSYLMRFIRDRPHVPIIQDLNSCLNKFQGFKQVYYFTFGCQAKNGSYDVFKPHK